MASVVAYALLATTVVAGLVLWPSLPERVAVHFGPEGRPDGCASRPVALVLAPLVGGAAAFVVRNAPAWLNDPPDSPAVLDATVLFVAGVVALAQGFLYPKRATEPFTRK